jgi:predicted NAD/FAD-dependent oxidoreductase
MSFPLQGHRRIDRRSLELHRAIAAKLQAHPALVEIARNNLERWSASHGRSQPYWDAWQEILTRPLPEILALLEEDSEHMDAMRQATPFAGVLEPAERWSVYSQFEPQRAGRP